MSVPTTRRRLVSAFSSVLHIQASTSTMRPSCSACICTLTNRTHGPLLSSYSNASAAHRTDHERTRNSQFLASNRSRRHFSSSSQTHSNVGSAPIPLPPGVTVNVATQALTKAQTIRGRAEPITEERVVQFKGPMGEQAFKLPWFVKFELNEARRRLSVSVEDRKIRIQRQLWGTVRAYLANSVIGVSEGHSCVLRLVGVGYRATIENSAITADPEYEGQQFVSLKLGFDHPIELGVPLGVTASVPQPTRILLEGSNKEVVKQFAANIRRWRKPEPYKGKGIFVDGETIKIKPKKIK